MNEILRFFAIVSLAAYMPAASYAAPPVMPNGGLILRESGRVPPMPKKPADTGIERPPLKKPMAVRNNLHVTVRSFNFSGNNQFSDTTLRSLLSRYVDRDLGFADLQQAAAVITEYYRKAGFQFAYVYIPEQTMEEGQVELAILEGQPDNRH